MSDTATVPSMAIPIVLGVVIVVVGFYFWYIS